MSSILGTNQAPRVTGLYLNKVDDPAPGVPLASPSGSIIQPYTGQLGGILTMDTKMAAKLSYTTTGTLYAGLYQYVQFQSDSTLANARGQVLVWKDRANFIVTPDIADTTEAPDIAGIGLMVNTKGNYGFIQVAGKASVKFLNPLAGGNTKGLLVVLEPAFTPVADTVADATAVTGAILKRHLGYALEAPVAGEVKLVALASLALNLGN